MLRSLARHKRRGTDWPTDGTLIELIQVHLDKWTV